MRRCVCLNRSKRVAWSRQRRYKAARSFLVSRGEAGVYYCLPKAGFVSLWFWLEVTVAGFRSRGALVSTPRSVWDWHKHTSSSFLPCCFCWCLVWSLKLPHVPTKPENMGNPQIPASVFVSLTLKLYERWLKRSRLSDTGQNRKCSL